MASKLGDYCDFQEGYVNPSQHHPEYFDGDVKWIRAVDLNNGFVYNTTRTLTSTGFRSAGKSALLFEPDTIVISKSGTIGRLGIIKDYMCGNRATINIRPKHNCDLYFVFYFLRSIQQHLGDLAVGSVQKNLYVSILENIEVAFPDLDTQRKIGQFMLMFDSKIETNNKINDNLQQQAATLFSYFYDHAETEAGFTEIIQILGGGTPKTGESSYWNGNVPFFTPKDVGSPYTLITEKTITEEGLAHCNSRLYPVNTVFVTARGTVGKVGLSGVPMAMNQSCYALVGKDTHQLLVYFYTLKAVDRLKHKASGAVFDAITTRDFESECIMKLSDADTKSFLDVAAPMYQTILSNSIENLRLATLRDTLLPKLMSGEIDVSDIQL